MPLLPLLAILCLAPGTATIKIDTAHPGITISPDLYGIFFEEINCAGDGGIYAEMIRNRSFEDAETPVHWTATGDATITVDHSKPDMAENTSALKISVEKSGGAANDGYWGIPLKKGAKYDLSLWAYQDGRSDGLLQVVVESADGTSVYHRQVFTDVNHQWQRFAATITAPKDDPKARLVVGPATPGVMFVDYVSMFPQKTWNERKNGLRPDLAEMLNGLKPSFMRFPGGCWVEGDTMATAMRWKKTIGEPSERHTQPNLWQYVSTNGLGFHEYLQLCEDLGAAPLFVINCGMSHKEVVPMDKMGEFVQDALDAIEYANGPITSKWGAVRARNGHPKPFGLKYMEIGNENGGPAYAERYPLIATAIKKDHPEIKLIADVWGGYPKDTLVEMIDEHYYSSPQFFLDNADRYDAYDRKGPKVYVGEYAVTEGCGQGNLIAALGEAAFMTGMERNSDVVLMASYAPLFANVNYKKWNPDMIDFDNHRVYGTPSYYVQQLFSRNRGDRVLPASVVLSGDTKPAFSTGGIGVGTWGTQAEFKDLKVSQGDKVLYQSADGSDLHADSGTWDLHDGARRQTTGVDGTLASAGQPDWANYTLTLKARRLSGAEGFLITVGRKDSKNWIWWNVGGWGNTQTALEQSIDGGKRMLGRPVRGTVETGRWYDVKIEYSDDHIRCYLDGKLIQEATPPHPRPLQIAASKDEKTGEIILKVVNAGASAVSADLDLGLRGSLSGTNTVLTSASPADENSLDEPKKVAPQTSRIDFKGSRFEHVFPPYSLSVMRLRSRG